MFIKSAKENAGTMIFCNPNAGLYEYSYVQNEWISMYYELGLNVVLWNYRGYGRSKGSPDIKRLQIDGEIIVHYLRSELKLNKIGVHGESLGGCIACYLAKKCNLEFLFADRTFASLAATGYFNFGAVCYWGLRVFLKSDCDAVADFLGARCYKIIAADPHDEMINDLASLKSGVALRFIYPNYSVVSLAYLEKKLLQSVSHVLGAAEICNLVSALRRVTEDEKSNQGLAEIVNKLEELDAGGKSFCEILGGKVPTLSALLWIIVEDIWGSASYAQDELNSYMRSIEKINGILDGIETYNEEIGKKDELKVLQENLGMMVKRIEEKCGIHGELEELTQANRIVDYAVVGRLLPVSCGHCGCFNYLERAAYAKHLQVFLDNL